MTKVVAADTAVNQFRQDGGKSSFRLFVSLATAEIWVFLRQPVMIALTLLLPTGLIAITALTDASFNPHTWAQACSILIQQEQHNGQDGISLIVADSDASGTPMPTFVNVESGTGLQMLTKRYRKLGGTLEFIQDGGGQLVGWIPNMNGD